MILRDTETKEQKELKDTIAEVKEEIKEEVVKEKKTTKKKESSKTSKNKLTEEEIEKMIPEWKKQYGKIYKNTIDENDFVIWRRITRREYKEIMTLSDMEFFNKQEEVVKTVLLYPSNADELIESIAGLATVLTEDILSKSGFDISETEEL